MGEFLTTPIKEKTSQDGENDFLRFGACGMQGWRKRMEDSHLSEISIGPNNTTHLFGVFDGHGGKEVATFIKRHFIEEFLANENYTNGNIEVALAQTYLRMDQIMMEPEGKAELKEEATKAKEEDDAMKENKQNTQVDLLREMIDPKSQPDAQIAVFTGCTANVCLIHENRIFFANAGDSRSVLCKKGNAFAMSEDHKPELPKELKRIEKAGGWVSDGRVQGNLNLSRSLGDLEYKLNKKLPQEDQMISANPDIIVDELTNDCDFVVLACDGIWDCKNNQEVCDFICEKLNKNPNMKLSKIIENLFDEILAPDVYTATGAGCDNMTCIVVQFKRG